MMKFAANLYLPKKIREKERNMLGKTSSLPILKSPH